MDSNFVNRLKYVIKSSGGNKVVSEATGIALGTLSGNVRGITQPSFQNIIKIADHCEVSLEWLAYGVEKNTQDALDKEALVAAFEVIEDALEKRNGTMPAEKKSEVLMLAYEILIEEADNSDKKRIADLKKVLKLVG